MSSRRNLLSGLAASVAPASAIERTTLPPALTEDEPTKEARRALRQSLDIDCFVEYANPEDVDRWVEGVSQGISEVSQVRLSPPNAFSGFCGPVFWTIGPNTPPQGKSPPQAVFLRRREVSPSA